MHRRGNSRYVRSRTKTKKSREAPLRLSIATAGFFLATLLSIPALAQTRALVTEEMMVKTGRSRHRNICPQQAAGRHDLVPAGADRALRSRRDLSFRDGVRPQARWRVLDGIHRLARLRRLAAGPARLRQIHAAGRDGRQAGSQCAYRHRPDRGQGHRHRRRLHPAAPQHSAPQPAGLVLGHDADGDLHHAKRRARSNVSCSTRRPGSGRRLRWCRPVPASSARTAWSIAIRRRSAGTPACPRTRKPRSFPPAGSTPGRMQHSQPIRTARR